jgi:hypothetical protein
MILKANAIPRSKCWEEKAKFASHWPSDCCFFCFAKESYYDWARNWSLSYYWSFNWSYRG